MKSEASRFTAACEIGKVTYFNLYRCGGEAKVKVPIRITSFGERKVVWPPDQVEIG